MSGRSSTPLAPAAAGTLEPVEIVQVLQMFRDTKPTAYSDEFMDVLCQLVREANRWRRVRPLVADLLQTAGTDKRKGANHDRS